MVFLWFSYGFLMVFLWFSYGFPMDPISSSDSSDHKSKSAWENSPAPHSLRFYKPGTCRRAKGMDRHLWEFTVLPGIISWEDSWEIYLLYIHIHICIYIHIYIHIYRDLMGLNGTSIGYRMNVITTHHW